MAFWPLLAGKGVWGRRWMRIKPPFPYVRKSIVAKYGALGMTAIGIENAKEAVPVVVWLPFFLRFFFD